MIQALAADTRAGGVWDQSPLTAVEALTSHGARWVLEGPYVQCAVRAARARAITSIPSPTRPPVRDSCATATRDRRSDRVGRFRTSTLTRKSVHGEAKACRVSQSKGKHTLNTGSYYEPVGEYRYRPTSHTSGAWSTEEQHFSPFGGLLVHAIERHLAAGAKNDMVMSRVSFDILGRIAIDECEIRVETVRPGRTIELIEAVALIADRPVVRARAWFLAAFDTSAVAGGTSESLVSPGELEPWHMASLWPGGYIASLDVRPTDTPQPGRTAAWISTDIDLVAGQSSSRLASYVALVDTANGIAVRESPTEWMFPNVDLTLHFHRQPEGRWTGLDTTVTFGPTGQGVTSTVLHDVTGPVGHAQQMLTVRPMPAD